jgi:hypothetical protein
LLVEEHLDPTLELVDLAGELKREPGLDGDVVGKFAEVDFVVVPEPQRFGRRFQQRDCLVLAVVAVGVAPDEFRKPCLADSTQRVRVSIAGGEAAEAVCSGRDRL